MSLLMIIVVALTNTIATASRSIICAEYSQNLRRLSPAEVVAGTRLRIFTDFLRKSVFEYAQIAGFAVASPKPKPIIFAEYARNMRRSILSLTVFALSVVPADAAPPPAGSEDAEMMAPMHDWINSARNPQGWLCCSEADARPVDVRTRGDHYEVRFMHPDELPDPKPVGWQTVPADAIMRDEHGRAIPAPEGVPVAWWYNGVVRCFAVPGGV